MATPGTLAFTPETHAELLKLAPLLSDIELAFKFGTSIPTIRKWKRLPIGHEGGRRGRKKTRPSSGKEKPGFEQLKKGRRTDAKNHTFPEAVGNGM